MKRRDLIAMTPFAIVAGSASADVTVNAETPIMALYREFKTHSDTWAHMPADISNEEEERQYAQQQAIEDKIMALPSLNVKDMAIKMMVGHGFGDHSCLDFDGPVWAEARALLRGVA